MAYQTLSKETLAALAKIDTPSICNAIEGSEGMERREHCGGVVGEW